jgi:hypothetical protein
MKYLYAIIIMTFIGCQKETKNSRSDLSGTYLVHYNHTTTYQVNSWNGDIAFATTNFDTTVTIEVLTTETPDSKIKIFGLNEFENNISFSEYETQPILKDDGKFYLNNEELYGSSGFLRNDSISYKIDRTVGLETEYITIKGAKI